jgi:hypothetical protein
MHPQSIVCKPYGRRTGHKDDHSHHTPSTNADEEDEDESDGEVEESRRRRDEDERRGSRREAGAEEARKGAKCAG